MKKKTVSVYGYGRFGKLWADILSDDHNVKVFSRRGLRDDEVSPGIELANAESIFDCDAMFFCVAISSFEELLIQSQKQFKKETIFFDTCSVKVYPTKWMTQHLPKESQIIATHPMFGPDSFKNGADLPMVMCDVRTNGQTFNEWVDYFKNKKLRMEIMSADEHDKMVAYSQGITHYVGRVLADLNLESTTINTLGYKKLLEITEQTCNDSWQLFIDLQRYNPHTKKMRRELHDSLERIYSIFDFD